MPAASLRELGMDLVGEKQFLRALGVFAESVRRAPDDHRSRMMAGHCLAQLGERERAVLVLHACAEGLLRRDFLLSAMAACKEALALNPQERMVRELLLQVHGRAVRAAAGRAMVPPAAPRAEPLGATQVEDLMSLEGSALADRAMEVLMRPDHSGVPPTEGRPPLPLFADLPPDAFLELVAGLSSRQVPPGTVLAHAAEVPTSLFVLVAGKAEVTLKEGDNERVVGFLGGGSMFGEVSLLTGTPSAATVKAAVPCDVFEVTRDALKALVTAHPAVAGTLASFGQQRLARTLLKSAALFLALTEPERLSLMESFEFQAFEAGEACINEGQPSPGLFIVLGGALEVRRQGASSALAVLKDGDVAGEISLLNGSAAMASVVAQRQTATAFLPRSEFHAQLARFPNMRQLLQQLSQRRLAQAGGPRPAEVLDADELIMDAGA
jgi:CRP-like cAMP-binding protein